MKTRTERQIAKADKARARFERLYPNHDHDGARCPCQHCDHDRDVAHEEGYKVEWNLIEYGGPDVIYREPTTRAEPHARDDYEGSL